METETETGATEMETDTETGATEMETGATEMETGATEMETVLTDTVSTIIMSLNPRPPCLLSLQDRVRRTSCGRGRTPLVRNPPPPSAVAEAPSGFPQESAGSAEGCRGLGRNRPHPFGILSLFAPVVNTEQTQKIYVASSNHLFMWFSTHAHIIKSNIPNAPKYAHVHALDEVDLAMAVVGYECFPELTPRMRQQHFEDVDTILPFTVDQYNQTLTRLLDMGVPIAECTYGECASCHAYHAFIDIRPWLCPPMALTPTKM